MTPRETIDAGETLQIILPFPPSVNGYWRSIVRGKGPKAYPAQIISEAGREYITAVASTVYKQSIGDLFNDRKVSLEIHLHPRRRGSDIDNFTKGLFDALTKSGVWNDDSQIVRCSTRMRKPIKGGFVVLYARLATPEEIDETETFEVAPAIAAVRM